MKKYIGTKIIKAKPMTKADFQAYKNMPCTEDDINKEGYLVGYPDADGTFSSSLEEGCQYISWSPKHIFESAYHILNKMNFGQAIEAMKDGHKVCRDCWNGRGIFIKIQYPDESSKMTHPYIYIDTTDLQTVNPLAPKVIVPWLASQTDMLAEDWNIIDI